MKFEMNFAASDDRSIIRGGSADLCPNDKNRPSPRSAGAPVNACSGQPLTDEKGYALRTDPRKMTPLLLLCATLPLSTTACAGTRPEEKRSTAASICASSYKPAITSHPPPPRFATTNLTVTGFPRNEVATELMKDVLDAYAPALAQMPKSASPYIRRAFDMARSLWPQRSDRH